MVATATAIPDKSSTGQNFVKDSLKKSTATAKNTPSPSSSAKHSPSSLSSAKHTQVHTSKVPAAKTSTSAGSQCTPGDTSSAQGVEKILDSTGAIDWLDIFIATLPDGEKDWVDKIWPIIFPNEGASPLSGCGDIGGDCPIDTNCQHYEAVMAYWVYKSVASLHSKINAVRAELLWTGWLDGLSIDQIAKDFSFTSPDQTWAKWVSAAFSMAGGFATGVDLSKPLRGMMGFAAAGLTDVSLTNGATDAVDKTSVENTLRNIVGAAGNYVASILTNATGNGNAKTLPIYTESTLQYATSRFFLDNTILIDENADNSSFIGAYKGFAQNVVCSCVTFYF